MPILLGLLLAWGATTPAAAGDVGKSEFSLLATDALPATHADISPMTNNQALGRPAPLISLRYVYEWLPRLGLGIEAGYVDRGRATSHRSQFVTNTELVSQVTNRFLLAVAKWRLGEPDKISPYLIGGIGMHRSNVSIALHPIPGFVWAGSTNDRIVYGTDSAAAGEIKAGIDIPVTSWSTIGLEGGWLYLQAIKLRSQGFGPFFGVKDTSPSLDMFMASAAFSVRF